jgi:hypothetical protein
MGSQGLTTTPMRQVCMRLGCICPRRCTQRATKLHDELGVCHSHQQNDWKPFAKVDAWVVKCSPLLPGAKCGAAAGQASSW